MVDNILDLIAKAIEYVVDFIIEIIDGIINFWNDIVNYFKKLNLVRNPKKDIFILDGKKFGEMLHGAPVKDFGIYGGVFNEETNEIEHGKYIGADGLDEQTKNVLGEKGIAILT